MMKLHVHNMRKWVYCELCSNCWIVLCCCWFVVEFMFDWCCCCYEIMLLMIHNLGVHNYGLWSELSCCCWFCGNGLIWCIMLKWQLFSCLICFWKPFWVHEPINNLWERIWVLGDQNWGFWVKRGWNPKVFCITDDCSLKRTVSEL